MADFSSTGIRALCLAMAAVPAAVHAQAADSENRPVISEIRCEFTGVRKLASAMVYDHLRLKVGDEYGQKEIDASIRALYATGHFSHVMIEPERVGDKVVLHVRLTPYLKVSSIRFAGNREWSDDSALGWFEDELLDELDFKVGDSLNEVLIKRGKEKIIKKYDAYYPFATVDSEIKPDGLGGAQVLFTINEGYSTKIQRVRFEGNKAMSDRELLAQMETASWSWTLDSDYFPTWRFLKFSFLSGYGRFHKEEFRDDLEKLRGYCRNQGFLDVEIPEGGASVDYVQKWDDDRKGRLGVTIRVTEGRRYSVGGVTIEGNRLGEKFPRFTSEAILAVLARPRRDVYKPYPYGDRVLDLLRDKPDESDDPSYRRTSFDYLKPGDWYAPKAIDDAEEKLRDYYGEVGYLDAQVRAERIPNLKTGKIDVILHVAEGEKSYLRSINIAGNTKTRSTVIVRELALEPGEVFDLVRMKTSEARLKNTRYFEDVRLSPQSTNIPNQKNLRISIKEGPTAQLSFGVGFSTVESIIGFAEYQETNFDLFNSRNYFRGGGQKFRLRLSVGALSNSIEQSYENPQVSDTNVALGYSAYRRASSFISSDYNTTRTGFQPYMSGRLFEQVTAQPTYRLENVNIDDIAAGEPSFIQNARGDTLISAAGVLLRRDTRDSFLFPTWGNLLKFDNWVAGGPFGGQVEYYKFEATAVQFIPIFTAADQTLQLLGKCGAMTPFGGEKIPFFERFYLGGAYDMRGFKFGRVGPILEDEAAGGSTYAYLNAEYTIKIIDPVRFALFYDWGFNNSGAFDFDATRYNDDVGFGFRIMMLGALMRIDVGFPLTASPENDNGPQFNFSFGTTF